MKKWGERDEELRAAHEDRLELFRTAHVIIVVLNGDGSIAELNPYMEQLTGYRFEEVRGRDWFSTFIPKRDRNRIRQVFQKAIDGVAATGNVNVISTKDGRELEIEWFSSVLTEEDGALRGILAVGHDITERSRAQRLLESSERQLQELSARLMVAQEDERRRVSRELHDDVGQSVALIGMEIDHLANSIGAESAEENEGVLRQHIDRLRGLTGDTHDRIRSISHRLHPTIVEHLGLATALRTECDAVNKLSGVSVAFREGAPVPIVLRQDLALCLYRVAQEALRNAISHAGSPRIEVSLGMVDDRVRLAVRDWGVGFDPRDLGANPGLGLISMRERARLVDGRLDIESKPGRGTVVTCSAPPS